MKLCIVLLCLVAGLNSRQLEQDGDHVPLANSRQGAYVEGLWGGKFLLRIERIDDKTLRLVAWVVNSIVVTVTEEDGKFVSGEVVVKTKVDPAPEKKELENRVVSMLGNITGLRGEEGNTLVLESNGDKEIFDHVPEGGREGKSPMSPKIWSSEPHI